MYKRELKNNTSIIYTGKQYPVFPYENNSDLFNALLDTLEALGLSRDNPFKSYISPNQTALIKPNWVRDRNPLGYDLDSLITHPSLIKYIIDLLVIAMEGKGTIIIADAPLQNCNFDNLKKHTKIQDIVDNLIVKYPNISIIVEDWRITTLRSVDVDNSNVQSYRITGNELIAKEYNLIDLGRDSFLEDISKYADRFRVTKYKPSLTMLHHKQGKHEYLVTKRISDVDFFINVPKLKTHIKAGLTCALKNLVGINGHKEFLPHHIKGSYFEGGDNYCNKNWLRSKYEDLYDYVWENINNFSSWKRKILMRFLQILLRLSILTSNESITAGSWMGNDTIWRTTLDLNHIAYFKSPKKVNILNIVDGIIAGEGQGPLEPTPKPVGILLAGENPAYVDAVVAKIMGYSISKIPTVYNAIYNKKSMFSGPDLNNFEVDIKDINGYKKKSFENLSNLSFKKPLFWEGA